MGRKQWVARIAVVRCLLEPGDLLAWVSQKPLDAGHVVLGVVIVVEILPGRGDEQTLFARLGGVAPQRRNQAQDRVTEQVARQMTAHQIHRRASFIDAPYPELAKGKLVVDP